MSPRWNWEFPEYSPDWDDIRKRVIWRDGGRCQECGSSRRPFHIHHIVSLSQGGSDDPSNLITLCEDCHSEYHSHMGGGRRIGWVPSTRPTFYPQLGVTSAQLREYEKRHGLTDTPYSFESLSAALESPYGAFPPASVTEEQPRSAIRRASRDRTLAKVLCVAMLVMINAAVWAGLIALLLYYSRGNSVLQLLY